MNATSVDIADMLEEESSLGLTLGIGGNLFVGREPHTPVNSVTIFDTSGYPPLMTLDTQGFYRPSVQIRVRNTDYVTGYNLIWAIMAFLHGKGQEAVNGTLYSSIKCLNDPGLLD